MKKGKKHTLESRKKMSKGHLLNPTKYWLNKDFSKKHRENLSKRLKGKFGNRARGWKGDKAGYTAIHSWIIKHYGNANKCEKCNIKNAKKYEWANISKKYKRMVSDYKQLCTSCHRIYDKGNSCKRGHKYTKDNLFRSKGYSFRRCRNCSRINQQNYIKKKHA